MSLIKRHNCWVLRELSLLLVLVGERYRLTVGLTLRIGSPFSGHRRLACFDRSRWLAGSYGFRRKGIWVEVQRRR